MFVSDLFDFITFLRMQGQSRWYPPKEIMDALNRAVIDKWTKEVNDKGIDAPALRLLKTNTDLDIDTKVFELPEDYFRHTNISALKTENGDVTAEYPAAYIVEDDEWTEWKRLDGLLVPEFEYPVFRITGKHIEALPEDVQKIRLYYSKQPKKAVYNFETGSDGYPEFKESGSVDPEFPASEYSDLVIMTLTYLGIQMRDEILTMAGRFHKENIST